MKNLENIDNLGEDSQETSGQSRMSEELELRNVAGKIERSDNESKYEQKKYQTHLEYVRNLRSEIIGMNPSELDVFKEKYLPSLQEKIGNVMQLDAVNSAIEERLAYLTAENKRENNGPIEPLSDSEKEQLIKSTEDIFGKVKPPEGIDRVAFAKEILLHEPEIKISRNKVEELFKEVAGTGATENIVAELRLIIDESALTKEPDAVLKYVINLLAKCGAPFESLPANQQEKLRDAVVDVSAYAIDFTSMKPDVRRIKQMETGGNVDDFGRPKRAGVENPFLDFPEGKEGEEKIEALRRNFDQITGLTLRKIVERINGIIEEAGTLENVNGRQKKTIENQIGSICNQLGQERWWRARYLAQEQVDKYRNGLFELPEEVVSQIKERMIAEDVEFKTPFRRAIYNRLFGNYDEDYDKMADQAEKLQAAA